MVDGGLHLDAVTKAYGGRRAASVALDAVTATFAPGTFTAVMGPSGSGKSTLLHCAAGLDRPTSGAVLLGDVELGSLSERALSRLRRDRIGFVFQAFNLLPELTAAENVALPSLLAGRRPRRADVARALGQVGLADKRRARPSQLSGGQQQRVAIARALIGAPSILFADEPTGALDSGAAAEVLGLLRGMAGRNAATVLMVTHDPIAASYADRVVFLADGRIVDELHQPRARDVAERMTDLAARTVPEPRDPRGSAAGYPAAAYPAADYPTTALPTASVPW